MDKDLTQLTEKELKKNIPADQCGRAMYHNELVRKSIEKLNATTTFLNVILLILTGILVVLTFIMIKK